MVAALSCTVMPVRQLRWSTGTVKLVPKGAVFSVTMGCRSSRSHTSGKSGMQSRPTPWTMKFTVSGVIFSAAQMKSPSFSRSSASMTTITSPRAIASTARSMVESLRGVGTESLSY